jgi:signal peptidase I
MNEPSPGYDPPPSAAAVDPNPAHEAALRPRRGAGALAFLRETAEIILFAILIFFVVRVVVQNFVVEGPSMQPTLMPGQLLIVNKQAYTRFDLSQVPVLSGLGTVKLGSPQRGDIVVLHAPTSNNRDLIKRVVALPGETVEVRSGQVLIDGRPLTEPYIVTQANYSTGPQIVPADHVYVLGDNRANSSDSHVFGAIPVSELVGKALFVYWPPPAIGPAPNFDRYAGAS